MVIKVFDFLGRISAARCLSWEEISLMSSSLTRRNFLEHTCALKVHFWSTFLSQVYTIMACSQFPIALAHLHLEDEHPRARLACAGHAHAHEIALCVQLPCAWHARARARAKEKKKSSFHLCAMSWRERELSSGCLATETQTFIAKNMRGRKV